MQPCRGKCFMAAPTRSDQDIVGRHVLPNMPSIVSRTGCLCDTSDLTSSPIHQNACDASSNSTYRLTVSLSPTTHRCLFGRVIATIGKNDISCISLTAYSFHKLHRRRLAASAASLTQVPSRACKEPTFPGGCRATSWNCWCQVWDGKS